MVILVDFDNVHIAHRQRGLSHVVQSIIDCLGSVTLAGTPRVRIRLYGGWLTQTGTSRGAQRLAPELTGYPKTHTAIDRDGTATVIVSVEFAYSLFCEPSVHLPHTYRERAATNVTCARAPYPNCAQHSSCPIREIETLINTGACPDPGCSVNRDHILTRPEQKLVDTLLVTDLLYLAFRTTESPLVVVSTDDDMWPGIRQSVFIGRRVIQIHPVPGRSTPTQYLVSLAPGYAQYTLT